MKIPILTDGVQSWQIDQWIEQGYWPISFVKGMQGPIQSVCPGVISINVGQGVVIDVRSIPTPTREARLDGIYIVLGEDE